MFTRPLALIGLAAFVSAAAVPQAVAGSCCGCAYTCAPPPQIQVWGLSPAYVVNQGPVYSGPGFYTSPTYEGEVSTVDYPYVGYGDYPSYYRPYGGGFYRPYWQGVLPQRPRHLGMLYPHETGAIYRRGFGRRAITMSSAEHRVLHGHREFRDPRAR